MKLSRRQFFQFLGISTASALSPRILLADTNTDTNTDDIIIVVYQRGAADSLSLIPPYGDPDYIKHRPTLAIPAPGNGASSALDLDGYFGLHPAMAPLLPLYENNQLAIIHATGSPNPSHSHFQAQDLMERGLENNQTTFNGWLGRYLQHSQQVDDSVFRTLGMGITPQTSLKHDAPSIAMTGIDGFALQVPEQSLAETQAMLLSSYNGNRLLDQQAINTLSSLDLLADANPAQYPVENDAVYPAGTFGQQLMEVAQLIRSNIGIRAVGIDIGGWDTHEGQAATLDNLSAEFAQGLAAFNTDMGDAMANITLVSMTEFGRRVYENGSGGTDHGHASFMLAMGNNVNGGKVYHDWPSLSDTALYGAGDLAVTTDYRTVLAELISKRTAGMAIENLFPDGDYATDFLDVFG